MLTACCDLLIKSPNLNPPTPAIGEALLNVPTAGQAKSTGGAFGRHAIGGSMLFDRGPRYPTANLKMYPETLTLQVLPDTAALTVIEVPPSE
jgi:hypothetical protein